MWDQYLFQIIERSITIQVFHFQRRDFFKSIFTLQQKGISIVKFMTSQWSCKSAYILGIVVTNTQVERFICLFSCWCCCTSFWVFFYFGCFLVKLQHFPFKSFEIWDIQNSTDRMESCSSPFSEILSLLRVENASPSLPWESRSISGCRLTPPNLITHNSTVLCCMTYAKQAEGNFRLQLLYNSRSPSPGACNLPIFVQRRFHK